MKFLGSTRHRKHKIGRGWLIHLCESHIMHDLCNSMLGTCMDFREGSASSSPALRLVVAAVLKRTAVASPGCDARPLSVQRRATTKKLMPFQLIKQAKRTTIISPAATPPPLFTCWWWCSSSCFFLLTSCLWFGFCQFLRIVQLQPKQKFPLPNMQPCPLPPLLSISGRRKEPKLQDKDIDLKHPADRPQENPPNPSCWIITKQQGELEIRTNSCAQYW